ncbi:S-adenosyl-L-methionine-dependent methyltransferase [Sodiomyces alkalinus F11]|uniref:S-adenosyl-L-methionine-dependent methyltransferase n=1 Tax=Sodiomyces alkalinus (strain CBS 110278 / VKM F-3762 / F11) TaxID=1314773 RepID=A0A3N2Q5X9_SODAK|nr:S-adenosyl-L-methionine-dependent methyltransferase [Sodiomyces alkalinus F11]ROT42181.1 S-adenosyl-L-methionine-dependent methyltransferase [Sodiomyces alkalinus F11]
MVDPETSSNVIVEPDDVDDNDSSIGDDGADASSSTASLRSSILEYREENGRTYHRFRDGKYHFPNDEMETERLDLQHHIFYLTLDGKLGLAPSIQPGAQVGRVLDLGTGTGIWAMDFGDEHPEAEVVGIDLSPIQPLFVPPNVKFEIDDFEDDWTFSRPFDYIHSRMNNSSIANWEDYIRRSYENLAPGGYIELQEFTLPLSDDGTLTKDHALHQSMTLLGEAAAKLGRPFRDLNTLKSLLEHAGFEDVREHRYKWPSNTWPRDPHYKELGAWNYENIVSGLQGFLMAALTRGLGWSATEVNVLAAQARRDMADRTIHAYWPMIVVIGRKPAVKKDET